MTVTVEVTPQKDEYAPTGIAQEVDNGHVPDPETSVNKTGLPEGTTVTWKTTPDVSTPGSHPGVALVHYPDGTEDEVDVPVRVKDSDATGTPETQPEAPEFTGGVNTPDAPINEIPAYTDPIGSTGVDENGSIIEPPVVEATEFNGGVNGELPDPAQLPKVKLIITKWVDENGNELKPADAKTPKVLGEENEAFEHGEIEGYEFVRTEVDENGEVVTHIFRKVASSGVTQTDSNVKPQETPNSPQVSTNEKPTQAEKVEPKQKDSQTILPKTGTANGLGFLTAATTSILLGLGFMIPGKKEEEEE